MRLRMESKTRVLDIFTQAVGHDRYVLYLHDYGCPIGLRLALRHPNRVTGLIVQDGNAYEEGLGPQWDTAKAYWREPTLENRERLPEWLNAEGTREQYTAGFLLDKSSSTPLTRGLSTGR